MPTRDLSVITDDMRRHITTKVREGFDPIADIVQSALEVFYGDAEPDVLRPIAEKLTREAIDVHHKEQAGWPDVTDCDRLDDAFAALTQSGIVCRQDFSCCGTCGVAEIGAEMEAEREGGIQVRGYAFYHMQDTAGAAQGYGLLLNYGAVAVGEAAAVHVGRDIVAALERHGLTTQWDGSWQKRIGVPLDWKRRRPYEKEIGK
jgi:hypothetical protein